VKIFSRCTHTISSETSQTKILNIGPQFNPDKSQVMTLGGNNLCGNLFLNRKAIQWCACVKYLNIYFVSGKNLKVDLTAKRKYYGVLTALC